MNTERDDRTAGALVGLAAGDALGAGYEFGPPVTGPIDMIGGGLFGWEPGEWTDDTQMAICIAENSSPGHIDFDALGDRFIEWAHECNDIGNQTRAVLSRATAGNDLRRVSLDYHRANPDHSAGNGSLMRTGVTALPYLEDRDAIAKAARNVSDLTHADPTCGDACVLWTIAVGTAIETGLLPNMRGGLDMIPSARRDSWASLISEAEDHLPELFPKNGWVIHAFQAAWSAIAHTTPGPGHFHDGVIRSIRPGGDTDTVAAIAGTLLGATYGASSVPKNWVSRLNGWPGSRAIDLASLASDASRTSI